MRLRQNEKSFLGSAMPAKKRFTDEELRARKNARTAQRYRENKEQIAAYHALLHLLGCEGQAARP